ATVSGAGAGGSPGWTAGGRTRPVTYSGSRPLPVTKSRTVRLGLGPRVTLAWMSWADDPGPLTTTWQLLQVRSVRVYRPWASVVVWTPPRRGSPTLTTAPASGARPPAGSPPGPNGTTWVTVPRRARWAEGGGFVPA